MQNKLERRGLLTANAQDASRLRDPEDRTIDQLRSLERKEKDDGQDNRRQFPCIRFPSSLPDPDQDSFGSLCSEVIV